MDAAHLPAQIAVCQYCGHPLYAQAPVSGVMPGPLLHVACEVHERRDHSPHLYQ